MPSPRRILNRRFARHYAEMSLVMVVGMAALAVPARWTTSLLLPGVDGDDPTLMIARMALTMTLPMVAWMAWRGHGRRSCVEMSAAMLLPALGVILLLEARLLEDIALAMALEHVAMFAAMFLAMAARQSEYCASPGRRAMA